MLAASGAVAATNEITEPFQGVRLIHSKTTVPRQVDSHVVEIEMTAPGLDFLTTPSNGGLVGDSTPQTTRTFVTQVGAQLGINANFFGSAGSGQYNLLGLSVSNGDAYSPFQPDFVDALNVSASNVATIIRAIGTSGTADLSRRPCPNHAVGRGSSSFLPHRQEKGRAAIVARLLRRAAPADRSADSRRLLPSGGPVFFAFRPPLT